MGCDLEQHKMHMCALKSHGKDECIKTLSDSPSFECGNCGSKANEADNLCEPKPLGHIRAAVA